MSSILPVFPLKALCFPGHCLALRVFEERYIQLLKDCMQGDRSFVVALISRGEEVGAEATPYRVGTLVRFETVRNQGDFLLIRPQGIQRVYMDKFDRRSQPYLMAECTDYCDDSSLEPDGAALNALESGIIGKLSASGEPSFHMRELLEAKRESMDGESYSLFLCGCVQLPPSHLQHLLESRSGSYRVQTLLRLLTQASGEASEEASGETTGE